MKTIALYFDGTWNTPENRTNVYSLFEQTVGDIAGPEILRPFIPFYQKPFVAIKNAVRPGNRHAWFRKKYIDLRNSEQIRYYDQGVGTHIANLLGGGAFGRGVSKNIEQAYEFLCYAYEPDDELYVFGFSRGAYTARSLVGLLNMVGLLKAEDCDDSTKRKAVYRYYYKMVNAIRQHRKETESWDRSVNRKQENIEELGETTEQRLLDLQQELNLLKDQRPKLEMTIPASPLAKLELEKPTVKFIGVWDTVGAMGIPDRYTKLARFFPINLVYQTLPNTEICANVKNAFHAMAIDEHRRDFKPTPWTYPGDSNQLPAGTKVEQMWFVGDHSNVGGGYKDNYLYEIPRHWVQKKAMQLGLLFHRELKPSERAIYEPVKDSFQQFAGGLHKLFNDRYFRPIKYQSPPREGGVIAERIHHTVWQYYLENNYLPNNIPAKALAEHTESLPPKRKVNDQKSTKEQ